MSAPLVVGLDLSITATGICDTDGTCCTILGKAAAGDKRMAVIESHVYDRRDADLFVIEGLAVHGPGNGMAAAQVMGAVKVCLIKAGAPYVEVPPSTLKKFATGRGNATKPEMAVALYKRAGIELANDNETDAFLLRAAGLHALGHPLFDLPAAQVAALDKVAWPTREEHP